MSYGSDNPFPLIMGWTIVV